MYKLAPSEWIFVDFDIGHFNKNL